MTDNEIIAAVKSIDWEFSGADTQYLTHNIHRYSGKFIPQIAGKAIDILSSANDTILDSYMGSGTTLLEAALRERHPIGIDLNPLAVLISRVKNTVVQMDDLQEINCDLIPYVTVLASGGQLSLLEQSVDEARFIVQFEANAWRLRNSWNTKWYQPDVLYQLVQIYSAIEAIRNEKAHSIALVAFSEILRKSSNASSHYPNVMFDKSAKEKPLPAKAFLESICSITEAVISMSKELSEKHIPADILLGNNLQLPLHDESVDAIITHPPYIAAIPYAEYGSLSLTWLGFDCKELDSELTGGRRHSKQVVSRFMNDYAGFMVESHRVVKHGHCMFLMVGNPVSHGEQIDLHNLTIQYAEAAGFHLITTAIRHGENRRGNKMGDEYLLFFRKH